MQSGVGGCETCTARALPRSGVFARSGVLALSRVLAFSGVLELSNVLALSAIGDWTRPNLAERSVLFLRIGGDRTLSDSRVFSQSGTLSDSCYLDVPAAWLGPAVAWAVRMSSTSPITS